MLLCQSCPRKGSGKHLEKRITVNAQTLKILKKKIQKVKYTKVNGKQSEKRKLDVQSENDDQNDVRTFWCKSRNAK